ESQLEVARAGHTARLESDGRVWISDGRSGNRSIPPDEVFDPTANQYQAAATTPSDPDSLYATYISPVDGAIDVPLDTTITLRLYRFADVRSITDTAAALTGPDGPIATILVPAEGGRLLFVHPTAALQPSTQYLLNIHGVTSQNRLIAPATFSFTTKADDGQAQSAQDDELW